MLRGDLDGAENAYRKALEVAPGLSSAYQNLASLLEFALLATKQPVKPVMIGLPPPNPNLTRPPSSAP